MKAAVGRRTAGRTSPAEVQRQSRGGVILTVTSLEMYADGFLVQARLCLEGGRFFADEPLWPTHHVEPLLEASDERGGRYHLQRGSGGGDRYERQQAYAFTPTLDPAARELYLRVPAL